MSGTVVISIILVVPLVIAWTMTALIVLWLAPRRSPEGISRRLRTSHRPVRIKVRNIGSTWNPARPSKHANWLRDPGQAIYTLRDDGQVGLHFVYRDGHSRQFFGPPVDLPPGRRRTGGRGSVVPLIAYPACAIGGFALAYMANNGLVKDRLQAGMLGCVGGCLLAWLILTTTVAIHRVRNGNRAAATK